MEPLWQSVDQLPLTLGVNLRAWIACSDSLTVQFRKVGLFQVQVVDEYWGQVSATENKLLQISSSEEIWQRDVVLLLNHIPVGIAHSLVPASLLQDPALQGLLQLGTRPLGEVIFKELAGQRERLEYARLSSAHFLFQLTLQSINAVEAPLYARRSIVNIKQHKLLVNEVLLSSIEEYSAS
jgi:chorismate--pyruvate lyase